MGSLVELFVSLFQFSDIAILNAFIGTGICFLAYKISFWTVGMLSFFLAFNPTLMSLAHWSLRIGFVFFATSYASQLPLYATTMLSISGFYLTIHKII